MDQSLMIGVAGSAGLLLFLLVVVLTARRRGNRLRADRLAAEEEARAERSRFQAAAAGEREAAWAASHSAKRAAELADLADTLRLRAITAEEQASLAEGRVDELQEALSRAEADLADSRTQASIDADRIAELETELAVAGRELSDLRVELAGMHEKLEEPGDDDRVRLHAALVEADRLRDRVAALETALAAADMELPDSDRSLLMLPPDPWDASQEALAERDATIERLRRELGEARRDAVTAHDSISRIGDDAARLHDDAERGASEDPGGGLKARLVAREAELVEMERRLTALTGARNAELDRLSKRIESMERLYVEVDSRDSRIAQLEDELAKASGSLEAVRAKAMGLESELGATRRELQLARREVDEMRIQTAAERDRAPIARTTTDDVTEIQGIGPVIARILAENGITSLHQIAGLTKADVARIGPQLPVYPGRIEDDGWVAQARRLLGLSE